MEKLIKSVFFWTLVLQAVVGLVGLAVLGAVVYVVGHFVAKYW